MTGEQNPGDAGSVADHSVADHSDTDHSATGLDGPGHGGVAAVTGDRRPRGRGPGPRQVEVPEPLTALTGSGASVVGVEGAMRARDVSRPSPADLAAMATVPVRRATPRPGEP